MAYPLAVSLALGSSRTGLTLRGQLVDTSGVDSGSEITTGFSEIGSGYYLWYYEFPNEFRGGAKIYDSADPSTVLGFFAINPEEAEYVDNSISNITQEAATINVEVGHSNADGIATYAGDDSANISFTSGVRSA